MFLRMVFDILSSTKYDENFLFKEVNRYKITNEVFYTKHIMMLYPKNYFAELWIYIYS